MRIGILSMQRVCNYGSFLQAYALKTMLEGRGHEVVFIDIQKKAGYEKAQETKIQYLLRRLQYIDGYFFRRLKDSKKNKALRELLVNCQKEYLKLAEEPMRCDNCDAVVIGSDEIFNCSPRSEWGVSGQRFGMIPEAGFVFSYAASCGYTSFEDVQEEDLSVISSALIQMREISVRDSNTADFVMKITGREAALHLDPVLMYDFKEELRMGEEHGIPEFPYMVVYAYHNRIVSAEEIAAIKSYAAREGLKIIAVGGSQPWCDDFAVLRPFQVLAYFKHARCIVTDTFHGTVIAAKYNKSCAVIVRDSNQNKLTDLLKRLRIEERRAVHAGQVETVLDSDDSYASCNEVIHQGRENMDAYLISVGV